MNWEFHHRSGSFVPGKIGPLADAPSAERQYHSGQRTGGPGRTFVPNENRSSGRCIASKNQLYCGMMLPGQSAKKTMSTRSSVNPGLGRKPEILQGGKANGTAIWQKEEPGFEEHQKAEEADARHTHTETYSIQVVGAGVSIRGAPLRGSFSLSPVSSRHQYLGLQAGLVRDGEAQPDRSSLPSSANDF